MLTRVCVSVDPESGHEQGGQVVCPSHTPEPYARDLRPGHAPRTCAHGVHSGYTAHMTASQRSGISAIVLAAGFSRRCGHINKLLYEWRGEALLRHTIQSLPLAKLNHVIVVGGHQYQAVADSLDGLPVTLVHNPHYATGMASSIRCGVTALTPVDNRIPTADHQPTVSRSHASVMICLGDMPLIPTNLFERLIDVATTHSSADIIVPRCDERLGHPRLFKPRCVAALASLVGDQGAKDLMNDPRYEVVTVDCEVPQIHMDFDTIDSLDALQRSATTTRLTNL